MTLHFITLIFSLSFLNISAATDMLQNCLSDTSKLTSENDSSQKIASNYDRCIKKFKTQSSYPECVQSIKKTKHPQMIYLCSKISNKGNLNLCLKESGAVFDKTQSSYAGFAFRSCIENFKLTGTFDQCTDGIKSSQHIDYIDSCTLVKNEGTLKKCLIEIGTAFKSVNEQHRTRMAHQSCVDAFRKTGTYDECYKALETTGFDYFHDLCNAIPKEKKEETLYNRSLDRTAE